MWEGHLKAQVCWQNGLPFVSLLEFETLSNRANTDKLQGLCTENWFRQSIFGRLSGVLYQSPHGFDGHHPVLLVHLWVIQVANEFSGSNKCPHFNYLQFSVLRKLRFTRHIETVHSLATVLHERNGR